MHSTDRKSHIGPRAHTVDTVRTHRASLVSRHFSQLTASRDEARVGFTFLPPRIVGVDPTRVAPATANGFHGSERILDRRQASTLIIVQISCYGLFLARERLCERLAGESREKSVETRICYDVCCLLLFCHETTGSE